jgi:hypothetical protein
VIAIFSATEFWGAAALSVWLFFTAVFFGVDFPVDFFSFAIRLHDS